jgi:haloalkane dehalogenase
VISAQLGYSKQFADVDGRRIAYIEVGKGDPIVLLHGNPTSSFLWRNVIPELENSGRVIVPDLIGQGDSEKLPVGEGPERYSFEVAYRYLDGLLGALGVSENVALVIHDWGSGLGFHWARHHPAAVRGIAYMEAIVCPLRWEDWPEGARGIFQGFRSPKGEDLVLNRNMFVEAVLPSSVLRELSPAEMAAYREPFVTPDDRQPTLNWPRQIPIDGEPPHMVELVRAYGEFMGRSDIPKLFVNAEPGSILVGRARDFCRSWPNQQEVTVRGLHFLQEDSPREIGQAVAGWLQSISRGQPPAGGG